MDARPTTGLPDPKEQPHPLEDNELHRTNAALARERQRAALLRREVLRLQRVLAQERRYFDLIRSDVRALFDSLTWKFGATASEWVRRLTLRPRVPLVRDHMESIFEAARGGDGDEADNSALLGASDATLPDLLAEPVLTRAGPLLGIERPQMEPLRVAVIVARRGDFTPSGSAYIRLLDPLHQLARDGALALDDIQTPGELHDSHDCVVVQRNALPRQELVRELIRQCALHGTTLIFEVDDDLFATDFKARKEYAGEAIKAMQLLAREADAVTCSTTELASRLSRHNDNVVVIENALSERRWFATDAPRDRDADGPIRILYMGTRTHADDLALFAPAWKQLKSRYGDAVEFDRIGVVPERGRAIGNRVSIPGDSRRDSYPEFVDWMTSNNVWHVGIAPLQPSQFNRAKSPIKFFDYAALGLAVVASDLEPYRAVIRSGQNGILASDSPESWFEAIGTLLDNPSERRRLAANACGDVRNYHCVDLYSGRWLHLFEGLRAHHHAERELETLTVDERTYLEQCPDVLRGITKGEFASAQQHWETLGRHEVLDGTRTYVAGADVANQGVRTLSEQQTHALRKQCEAWQTTPTISVVMPVYRVPVRWLRAAVESVVQQAYPNWELCLCDDASADDAIDEYLAQLSDPRIKTVVLPNNRGISAASNAALGLATGSYVALLDHDDELSADALWHVARVINEHDPDVIYSDEAKLDASGNICDPHYKAGFSRELLQSQNYLSHLTVLRRSLVQQVGAFRDGVAGSQDHDLLLRACQQARSVQHIPRVLYFWRMVEGSTAARFDDKAYAWDAGVKALADLRPPGDVGRTVDKGKFPGTYRVRRQILGDPLVSIMIPFRDQPALLLQCVKSVLSRSGSANFEIVGIDNQSEAAETAAAIAQLRQLDGRVRFCRYDRPFNFSSVNNFGARHARGDHLLLLNNDVVVDSDDWITAMLEFSQLEDVGAVGGLLLYPDDTIQHAGVIVGIGGVAGHSHKYLPVSNHGYFSRPHVIQNVSAVTGACLMIKRELYLRVGGMDEANLGVAFNDIDLCLRLRERGYYNVYTPYARAYHHESKSRGHEDTPEKQSRFLRETLYMQRRHALRLTYGDPYYSPNLTLEHEDFRVRGE